MLKNTGKHRRTKWTAKHRRTSTTKKNALFAGLVLAFIPAVVALLNFTAPKTKAVSDEAPVAMLAKRTSDKPSRTGVRFSPEPTPTMPTQEPATPTAKPKVLAKPKALLKNIKPSAKPTKATPKKKAETPKKPQPVAKKKVSPKVKKDTSSISLKKCGSSAVESGLTPDAIRVHRAVCNKFPSISSYGGMRAGDSDSYHSKGRALDIMCTGATGDAVSSWLKANYKKLGVMELIWKQHIWTVQRSSEGWRPMTDRGSITANHYDHVHVSTYVDSGAL